LQPAIKSTAEFFKAILSDGAMQAIVSEITLLITGKRLVDLPEIETLYTAVEIGEMCGISGNMVDCIANELELKTNGYGMFTLSKGLDGSNQAIFQYKLKAVDRIKEFLDVVRKAPIEDVSLEEEFDLSGIYP
jgi:hypothetical protein